MKLSHLVYLLVPAVLLFAGENIRADEHPAVAETGGSAETKISVPEKGATFPMLSVGGRPAVHARINGQGPFLFIIDTGATQTVIDSSLASELSLTDAGGGTIIKQLEVGDVTLREFTVMVGALLRMPGKEDMPRGVLSAHAFPGYLITFDFPGKQITIRPGALGEPDGKTIFPYGQDKELPSVPVRVAGHEFQVHLDTGAPFCTLPSHEIQGSAAARGTCDRRPQSQDTFR